jgi:hypothetical protein
MARQEGLCDSADSRRVEIDVKNSCFCSRIHLAAQLGHKFHYPAQFSHCSERSPVITCAFCLLLQALRFGFKLLQLCEQTLRLSYLP